MLCEEDVMCGDWHEVFCEEDVMRCVGIGMICCVRHCVGMSMRCCSISWCEVSYDWLV